MFVSVAVLLAVFGSVEDVDTVAEFANEPAGVSKGTVYATVMVFVPPAGMLVRLQLKLGPPPVSAHVVPAGGVMTPRVNPFGHTSSSSVLAESEGPAFETVIVYVYVVPPPGVTWTTPSDFVTETSDMVRTVFESVAVLLPGTGSVVLLLTAAVFVWGAAGVDEGTV
jgi:hypothetical protein